MTGRSPLFLAALLILAGSSCLESPLLDHARAGSGTGMNLKEADGACPLFFPTSGLCASLSWETLPTNATRGSFLLRFWDAKSGTENGPYVTPVDSVFSELWMPSMGHGSSPVTIAPVLDSGHVPVPGVFRVADVFFIMGGHWEIWVQLVNEAGARERAKNDFEM